MGGYARPCRLPRWACQPSPRAMADFDIKVLGESWLLTPNNRAAQKWCQSNLTEDFLQAEGGYVVDHERLLFVIDEFMEREQKWLGF